MRRRSRTIGSSCTLPRREVCSLSTRRVFQDSFGQRVLCLEVVVDVAEGHVCLGGVCKSSAVKPLLVEAAASPLPQVLAFLSGRVSGEWACLFVFRARTTARPSRRCLTMLVRSPSVLHVASGPSLLTATPAVLIALSSAAAVCSLGRRCREGCAQSCDRPCRPLRRLSRCDQETRGRS